uniref:Hydrogenase cytochrome b-type subunit homolog n=1 Tax=Thermochromatium tepidum TaxID=1050 RepID=C7G529_THETI|nr:hydrogenase cytochrome b-type subunit homolog [Thermochromatium tepidum]
MQAHRIKLWDLPTRLFHWLLVLLVALAFATGLTGGSWIGWHGWIGLAILGLIVFRIVWGFIGSTYVRFSQFIPGPHTILSYLRGRWHGMGHNPLGGISVLVLLTLLLVQGLTGLFANDDIAFSGPLRSLVSSETSRRLSGLHRQSIWIIGGFVALHIAAILFHTWVRGDNLIWPMITGYKMTQEPLAHSARGGGPLALVLALAITAGAVWIAAGGLLPPQPPPPPAGSVLDW